MRRGLVAVAAAALIVGGSVAGSHVWAAVTGTNGTCTGSPVVTDTGTAQKITVVCSIPKPPAVTTTVTVPGPTQTVTVTAAPEPTQAPSTSTAPPPPVTTSAAPSPTATATSSPSGFPDASNTGVPAGTVLTAYTGPSTITTPGTVIEGKTLGCIDVRAAGVIIRKSHISCANAMPDVVSADDGAFTGTPLLLEDDEIDCKGQGGTAVGEANFTLRRVDIHGCENGGDINQNVLVEDSYIHDLYNTDVSHSDGLQFADHLEAGKVVKGTVNVTVRHSTIFGVGADGSLGTSSIIGNLGGDKNILIDGNLFGGGAFTVYCQPTVDGSDFTVTNNHFTKRFSPKYGAYGPSDSCGDARTSGNVDAETGKPLTLD